jgi:hypothetical protein
MCSILRPAVESFLKFRLSSISANSDQRSDLAIISCSRCHFNIESLLLRHWDALCNIPLAARNILWFCPAEVDLFERETLSYSA